MSSLGLYFIFMLDRFIGLFTVFAVIFIMLMIVSAYVYADYMEVGNHEDAKSTKAFGLFTAFFSLFFVGSAFLVPSTKQAILIWSIPTVVNSIQSNQKMQAIPEKLLTYINQELDSRIKDEKEDKHG